MNSYRTVSPRAAAHKRSLQDGCVIEKKDEYARGKEDMRQEICDILFRQGYGTQSELIRLINAGLRQSEGELGETSRESDIQKG